MVYVEPMKCGRYAVASYVVTGKFPITITRSLHSRHDTADGAASAILAGKLDTDTHFVIDTWTDQMVNCLQKPN